MFITVGIVAYNEEKVLHRILGDICNQDYPKKQIEVVLIDSMSLDQTYTLMKQFQEEHSEFRNIRVLKNPKQKLASGWNLLIDVAEGDAIIRIDAHAAIPDDFVRKNVECLASGEDICGGPRPNIAEENTAWQNTLLLAEASIFGSSVADYRRDSEKKYVKSLFHGAYRKEVFQNVGKYNENLGRTEDNEMHYRMRQKGYRLCYDPRIRSFQMARSTLIKMCKQKYGNGYWVALTMKVCPKCISIYHFVPFVFVLAILTTTFLSCLGVSIFSKMMWTLYGGVAVLMSLVAVKGIHKSIFQLLLPIIFLLLHVSYGVGSVVGFLRFPFWNGKE